MWDQVWRYVHQVKTQAQDVGFGDIFVFNLSCKASLSTFMDD